jgi:hypothetical protein
MTCPEPGLQVHREERVTAPVDLTDKFGEGWCVTATRRPIADTLRHMGVREPTAMPDGLTRVTQRLLGKDRPGVLLLARQAAPGWTIVLELEGTTGWVGAQPDVLHRLSAAGGMACSMVRDPNRIIVLFAEDGHVRAGLDAITGRRWGSIGRRLAVALAAAGLPDDEEPVGEIAGWTSSQVAAAAMQAATGIRFHDKLFNDPWTGGLSMGIQLGS